MADIVKLTMNLPRVVRDGTQGLADDHGNTFTEEVRRALSLWYYLHGELGKENRILIEDPKGKLREIIFFPQKGGI